MDNLLVHDPIVSDQLKLIFSVSAVTETHDNDQDQLSGVVVDDGKTATLFFPGKKVTFTIPKQYRSKHVSYQQIIGRAQQIIDKQQLAR